MGFLLFIQPVEDNLSLFVRSADSPDEKFYRVYYGFMVDEAGLYE